MKLIVQEIIRINDSQLAIFIALAPLLADKQSCRSELPGIAESWVYMYGFHGWCKRLESIAPCPRKSKRYPKLD